MAFVEKEGEECRTRWGVSRAAFGWDSLAGRLAGKNLFLRVHPARGRGRDEAQEAQKRGRGAGSGAAGNFSDSVFQIEPKPNDSVECRRLLTCRYAREKRGVAASASPPRSVSVFSFLEGGPTAGIKTSLKRGERGGRGCQRGGNEARERLTGRVTPPRCTPKMVFASALSASSALQRPFLG